jgi:hypothetical protein
MEAPTQLSALEVADFSHSQIELQLAQDHVFGIIHVQISVLTLPEI